MDAKSGFKKAASVRIMDRYEFKVEEPDKEVRLDVYLHGKIPIRLSRTDIQYGIKQGDILVNGLKSKPHYRTKTGDTISAGLSTKEEIDLIPENIPLDVVFEDEELLVINKPAGLIVHPGSGVYRGTMVNALLAYSNNLSWIGGKFKPGIVHRLDKDTSGLLVVAKTDVAHIDLARQFKAHTIFRRYVALVRGVVELDEGEVDVPIGRHLRDRTKMAVKF
ncbi:MAG: RluA family pseudouridine synthase, partial [Candidatus Omnitrophica bacterium]|nr:RluA family pseudouridine synthase [Candidatus Omnitrophota bacterium]